VSKVDAQRAMREARFAAYQASLTGKAGKPAAAAPAAAARARATAGSNPPAAADQPGAEPLTEADAAAELCGHKNMSNKTCRRPAGHPEKNHRYT
jgi:hypothetical protein